MSLIALMAVAPLQAIDDVGDDSSPVANNDTPFELPEQIIPNLDNTTYLYYFESDDVLLDSINRSKRFSFGTLPDDKVTLLVYGLDDVVVPRLALYNAEGERIREGTSPLTPYVTGLEFEAGDKELFFFEVTAENNQNGVVRVMLFEGDPFNDDLTLLDTINPLLPGRAFLVAGDHIQADIVGLDVRVEVLPVPRFEEERPEVFASRGSELELPIIEERFTPIVRRGWANSADVPIYTINVRAAPEPLTSATKLIAFNKALNLSTFFYFEYHLIIGKGSVPRLLVRGDDCQSNPNRPECIRSTGESTGRSETAPIVPTRNDAPPVIEPIIFGLPVLPQLGDVEPPPFIFVPPTVTVDCFLPNPAVDINVIVGDDPTNVNFPNDVLGGTGCRDQIFGGDGNDSLDGGIRSDELFGENGDDKFFDDTAQGFYDDTFDGGPDNDTLEASTINNSFNCYVIATIYPYSFQCDNSSYSQTVNYNGTGAGNVVINADTFTSRDNFICDPFFLINFGFCFLQYFDTEFFAVTTPVETNTFTDVENIISGGTTDDRYNITPDAINNTFDGGAGVDTANYGGFFGAITFDVSGTTRVIIGGTDTLENFENYIGSNGVDTLNITNTTGITLLNYNTGASDDIITIANAGTQAVTINGGAGNEIFTLGSDANSDIFDGGADNDVFNTLGIVDIGVDRIVGGTGVDTLNYTGTASPLYVDYNAGISEVRHTNAAGQLLDTFEQMDNVTTGDGTADYFSIEFDGIDNTFTASGGANTFTDADVADYSPNAVGMTFNLNAADSFTATQGGGVTDTLFSFETLIGTAQDDTFNITRADFFQPVYGTGIQGGGGADTFNITTDAFGNALFDGGIDIDQLNILDAGGIAITSLAPNSYVVGGDVAQNFENVTTAGGADTFTITADAVNNIFNGAGGNDTFTANGGAVTFNIGAGDITVVGGGGIDTLQNIENIVGGAGNDIFEIDVTSSSAVPITLNGGAGNNLFRLNGDGLTPGTRAITITTTGGGTNWLSFSGITGTGVTINLNNLVQNPFGATFTITLDAALHNLIGTNQADNLVGTNQVDVIDGGDGNDTIGDPAGGGQNANNEGADTIYGGLGNDTIYGGDGGDTIYGGVACGGLNTPAGSYILAVPAGSNDGNDTIVGGTGSDTLYGGNNNSTEANANNCNDGNDSVADPNSGDIDTLYGGNNNTGGGTGADAADTLAGTLGGTGTGVSVDEFNDADAADTGYAGNNNAGGGTGIDAAGDTVLTDPNDVDVGDGNNPP